MSSVGRPAGSSIELLGTIQVQPEPGYAEPEEVSVAAMITDAGTGISTERDEDGLRLIDASGPIFELAPYSLVRVIGGAYEVHAGVVREDDGAADVFAMSDPVELALAGVALAACLAIHAGQLWLIKQTLDVYRSQGHTPKLKIRAGFRKAVTCQFDVDLTAVDHAGRIVASKKLRVGRRGK